MSENMRKWTYKTDLYWIVDSYLGDFADNYDIDAIVSYIMREYADNPDVITDEELLDFDLGDVAEMFAK